jgi:hypothetical protein
MGWVEDLWEHYWKYYPKRISLTLLPHPPSSHSPKAFTWKLSRWRKVTWNQSFRATSAIRSAPFPHAIIRKVTHISCMQFNTWRFWIGWRKFFFLPSPFYGNFNLLSLLSDFFSLHIFKSDIKAKNSTTIMVFVFYHMILHVTIMASRNQT